MKKTHILFGFLFVILFSACDFDASRFVSYQINEPVVMSLTEFRNSVQIGEARNLTSIGKICSYNGYLYISDIRKGIYVIDNQNPTRPKIKSYIELQGNTDLCIHNDRLYADAWIDLVWFNLSNPVEPQLDGRLPNAFPEVLPEITNNHPYDYELVSAAKQNGIVVGWELKTYEKKEPPVSSNKKTGLKSHFGLIEDYLYVISYSKMYFVDLSANIPVMQDNKIIPDVETIYPYKNNLFLGMPSEMSIYSLEDLLNPTYTSSIPDLFGCNPIVVSDDFVYATIRSGNFCGQANNELLVIDVSNIEKPKPSVSYEMKNPKGLSIDKNLLFLCDNGLKIFKLDNPQAFINDNSSFCFFDEEPLINSYDVIPWHSLNDRRHEESILIMVSDNGLYQYDYSGVFSSKKIRLLSVIPVEKQETHL